LTGGRPETVVKVYKLGELARELAERGETSFRESHDKAFLLAAEYPEEEFDDFDQRTLDTNSNGQPGNGFKSLSDTTPDDLAIEVVKSRRNIFKSKVLLGRAQNNDIPLKAAKISKIHCAFVQLEEGRFDLVDMDSLNGTLLNGERLEKDDPKRLKEGDQIGLWKYRFVFVRTGTLMNILKRMAKGSLDEFQPKA
jgi:hypothetical protein